MEKNQIISLIFALSKKGGGTDSDVGSTVVIPEFIPGDIETLDPGADVTVKIDSTDPHKVKLSLGIPRGANGYTPIKGVDFWTESDIADLVKRTIEALPAAEEVRL